MHAPRKRTRTMAALAGATMVAFSAGCSDGEGSESDGGGGTSTGQSDPAYELQPEGLEQSKSVTVRLPEDLRDVLAAEEEEETLMADSYQIETHELESTDHCAVDLKPEYAEGAVENLTSATTWGDSALDTEEESLAVLLGIDEGGLPVDELDEADPQDGAYVSQDRQTITLVQDCASAPSDFSSALTVGTVDFTTQDDEGRAGSVAEIEFTVMADGTISVLGEATDYERDSNGDWIGD